MAREEAGRLDIAVVRPNVSYGGGQSPGGGGEHGPIQRGESSLLKG